MQMTEAFKAELYREFHGKVLGFLRARTNDPVLAEDLCSEVFVKLYEKAELYDENKASLSTWIYTVTRNTLTDHFRTRRIGEPLPEELQDGGETPEALLCRKETLQALTAALRQLSERERDLIVFRYDRRLTLKEIAQKMGLSYSYTKQLHNRALAKLKKMLEKE